MTFNIIDHEININNVIKNLNTVIDDQQMEIKKLNKQIAKIKYDGDDIIKNLDYKLFILRAELRKIHSEKSHTIRRKLKLQS